MVVAGTGEIGDSGNLGADDFLMPSVKAYTLQASLGR